MARILVAVFGVCLLALGASPAAHAAKRVAFVVGIDSYDKLPEQQQLKKAVNDAQAIGEAFVGRRPTMSEEPTSCGLQPI